MKISHEYPNYVEAVLFVMEGRGYSKASDDSKKLAYQIPLASHKLGVDFYELNRAKDGSVYFTIVTMLGLKTICETNSKYHYTDMSVVDWQHEIFDHTYLHFNKEEYIALKKGYVKKKGSGCLGMLIITLLFIGTFYVIT